MSARVLALLVLVAGLPACRGCASRRDAAPAPGPSATPAPAVSLGVVPAVAAPTVTAERGVTDVALPAGCTVEPPVRDVALPAGSTWKFVAGRSSLDTLIVANAAMTARGIVELGAGTVDARIPWTVADAPPPFDRAARGWVAAVTNPGGAAVLWRQWAPPLAVARGDQLRVADLACDGARCAVLTTLARASAVPGATLVQGDAARDVWQRVDIEAEPGAEWLPLSIASLDASSAWVALAKNDGTALYRVEHAHAVRRRADVTPYGVYDAVATQGEPVVVAPGAGRDAPCSAAGFPLLFIGAGSKSHDVPLAAAPAGLIARPLGRGAVVAWIAPDNCRAPHHTVVNAVLVKDDGTPASAPMAVTTGSGFALATRGAELALWIQTDHGLVWLKGRCAL